MCICPSVDVSSSLILFLWKSEYARRLFFQFAHFVSFVCTRRFVITVFWQLHSVLCVFVACVCVMIFLIIFAVQCFKPWASVHSYTFAQSEKNLRRVVFKISFSKQFLEHNFDLWRVLFLLRSLFSSFRTCDTSNCDSYRNCDFGTRTETRKWWIVIFQSIECANFCCDLKNREFILV